MEKKINLYVVNTNYPFGKTETFLENEIKFISKYFNEVYLFPLNYPSKDFSVRQVPANVKYFPVLLEVYGYQRILSFVFKRSPSKLYFKDLQNLFKSGNGNYFNKLKGWFLTFMISRAFYNSIPYKFIQNNIREDDVLYFYWGGGRSIYSSNINHAKTFIRIHGRELDFKRSKNYLPLFDRTFTLNATYLAISSRVKEQISEKYPAAKVIINRLGTYDHGLGPNPDKDLIRIVSCSNVIPLKRVHLIIEALKSIKDQNVEWVHFGDGPLFNQLVENSLILNPNITALFKGRVLNHVITDFYKNNAIDLFINVSTFEGIPVSIMEALSFGIPCFATQAGATSELVNNTNGYIVPINFQLDFLTDCILNSKNFNDKRLYARKTWDILCNAEKNYKELTQLMISNGYDEK